MNRALKMWVMNVIKKSLEYFVSVARVQKELPSLYKSVCCVLAQGG